MLIYYGLSLSDSTLWTSLQIYDEDYAIYTVNQIYCGIDLILDSKDSCL
jgi:hypothetical protein